MKTLVGVTLTGHTKNYVLDSFLEMAESCIRPLPDVDILWSTDRDDSICSGDLYTFCPNFAYGEDIVMVARDDQRKFALENGYDKLVWQGIDCLYQSKDDFESLINHDLPAVGLLTAWRDNSLGPFGGHYYKSHDEELVWEEESYLLSDDILLSGNIVPCGMPGTDSICFDKSALDLDWKGKHDPWYVRVAQGRPNIGYEAWYCLELMRRGQTVWLDTSRKVWHVHEDLIARMWPGIESPLSQLNWLKP